MTVELATASYRSWVPDMGIPVATSVGQPIGPLAFGVELVEQVHALKPYSLMAIDDDYAFKVAYFKRLQKIGPSKLNRVFHAIGRKYHGSRLVVLCFECVERGHACHRRDFAAWWTHRTGRDVPELSWVVGADGIPVVVRELPASDQRERSRDA